MSIPDPTERPVLSVPEAGRHVGLGRAASYEAAKRGQLPTIRLSERRLVVPTAALRRMLLIDDIRPATEESPVLGVATGAEEPLGDWGRKQSAPSRSAPRALRPEPYKDTPGGSRGGDRR